MDIGAHAVAKSALLALRRSLAKQEAPYGINVNVVPPGFVNDPKMSAAERQEFASRIPVGCLASPEEVANAVLFLASSTAGYITGTNVGVTGGWGAIAPVSFAPAGRRAPRGARSRGGSTLAKCYI